MIFLKRTSAGKSVEEKLTRTGEESEMVQSVEFPQKVEHRSVV